MKDKIIEAIKQWNESLGRSIDRLTFAWDLKEKHRAKILQGFGKQVPFEEWIAVYDDSITGNGKKGILFTADKLYLYNKEPILLEDIVAAYKINVLLYGVVMTDGQYVHYDSSSFIGKTIPVLQLLTGITQSDQRPTKGCEELHTTYRRELRRRMNEVTKSFCAKNDRLVSIELAEPEVVKNAMSRWPEIDQSKVIGFLKTTRDNGKEAIVITEEAIYSGTNERIDITFDGLKKVNFGDVTSRFVLYENDHIESPYIWVHEPDLDTMNQLVDGYISIYQTLRREITEGNVVKSGLDLSEGMQRYFQMKEEYLVDTYKNSVFVSSTFRDMHFERDVIHEKVQPALSVLADQYGETISFCDLRWGVNTEDLDSEDGAKKVLIVCLDEIEKCEPYMLIMLGERYGWIPSEQTIKNALESRPDFALEELENSVTALEIEFGALSKTTDKDKIFVYFREMEQMPSDDYKSEDEHHAKKLAKLKERVRRLAPDRVKTYRLSWDEKNQKMCGVDAFAQMVIDDVGQTMEKIWSQKEKVTDFEREVQLHVNYMRQKAEMCYAREELLNTCIQTLENGTHLLALTGVSGCGKSTTMGALASILKECEVHVLPIFCGHTARTESALGLVKHMAYYIEALLGIVHYEETQRDISEDMWLGRLKELVELYSKEQDIPLFIAIDAIDQLTADHIRNSLKFIPDNVDRLNSKVYMVLSYLEDFELAAFPVKTPVPMLKSESKPQAIKGILKKNRRELDDDVIQKIMGKQASDSPLYLTLLIQRLLMMNKNDFDDIMADGDGMSAITKHQLEIVEHCGEDISNICREIIDVASKRIGGEFVKQAIDFISLSQHGLRENDLEGLLLDSGIPWNRLEFSLFMNYLQNVFVLRDDGCYDFSHKIFRQEFVCETDREKELHRKLFRWMEHLPENDFLRERELLIHCMASRETKGFMKHVAAWVNLEKNMKSLNQKFLKLCRSDSGRWLIEMVRSIKDDAMEGEEVGLFLKYVIEEIGREFNNSDADLRIRENLYLEMLPVAEYLLDTEGGLENHRRVSLILSRLGKVHELNKDYTVAEEYYKKTLLITEEVLKIYEDDKSHVDISIDYRVLANLYLKYGDSEHEEQAVSYYHKSIELAEAAVSKFHTLYARRMLSTSYDYLGDYYHNKGQSELALENYLKCREIRVAIVEEQFDVSKAIQLTYVLESIGDEYRETDKEMAAKYYDELVVCREKIVRAERTMVNMTKLAWAYNDAGYAYDSSEKEEYKTHALDRYEKCIPIFEEALKHNEDMEMLWHLADDYRYCVQILGQNTDIDSQKKLANYAHRAFELYEYRAKKLGTENAYYNWSCMLAIYIKLTNNRTEKIKSYEKKIEIMDILYEMTKDKNYKKAGRAYKLVLLSEKGIQKL